MVKRKKNEYGLCMCKMCRHGRKTNGFFKKVIQTVQRKTRYENKKQCRLYKKGIRYEPNPTKGLYTD